MTTNVLTTQVPLRRRLMAGAGSLFAAYGLSTLLREDVQVASVLDIVVLVLAIAALLLHHRALGAQLLVRAVWWANLGLGTAICVLGGTRERYAGVLLGLGCGAALLSIGRKGLAEASERAGYLPAAFRSSLMLLMALSLADAQTFGLFAILGRMGGMRARASSVALGIVALTFLVGFVGLYRLRVWGALLNFATAGVFALALFTRFVSIDSDAAQFFIAVCVVQMLAATPMLIGLVARRPLPRLSARARELAAGVVVAGLMLVDLYCFASA